jgi:hypothetical protein
VNWEFWVYFMVNLGVFYDFLVNFGFFEGKIDGKIDYLYKKSVFFFIIRN